MYGVVLFTVIKPSRLFKEAVSTSGHWVFRKLAVEETQASGYKMLENPH